LIKDPGVVPGEMRMSVAVRLGIRGIVKVVKEQVRLGQGLLWSCRCLGRPTQGRC
jgi:hypothetical protein